MIHLTYSNRTEELLAGFVDRASRERQARGPYVPLRVVVPNRNVETYLKFGLAEAVGIAANLEVSFLRRMVSQLTPRAMPGARLVDATGIEGHLLVLLHDPEFLAGPELGPLREYLAGAGTSLDALDRRRAQLAAELAELFDEYGASRPELLRSWRERATLANHPSLAGAERWQRALWLAIFPGGAATDQAGDQTGDQAGNAGQTGRPGLAAAHGARLGHTPVTLTELVRALERLTAEQAAALDLGPLHVFGVSYIARSFHAVLGALARHTDVHVYTLNPCREFWEDVETAGEARRRRKRQQFPTRAEARQPGLALGDNPFALLDDRENLALRLWGRPGRENIRLLNQQGGGDFDGRFVSSSDRAAGGRPASLSTSLPSWPPTLLQRLQDDILDRYTPAGPDPELTADDSLRVLPCPGVRRELEVIAGEIWRLVDADPTLRLNQIAVVVPEAVKDSYLSHVGAVFGEAHDLPHSIIDLPLSASHRLGDAALALLAAPLGGATRRDLLPLLTHPALIGRFPDAGAADWLRLAEDLGIVHGADRQDHEGTYIQRDLLNWDQGIRRVALGALMEPVAANGDCSPVELDGQQYLPLSRGGDEQAGALGFALLARSLLADMRLLAGVGGPRLRPLHQWAELIRALLSGYLVPAEGDEEALLSRCLGEVDALSQLPLADTPVSYRIAASLVQRALGRLGGAAGQYLAHGVTVTSFVPMRAIPFRVVFVAGLGQSNFPRQSRGSELDLRAARRQLGDVSPREQDLYMFLETVLSTRERLVLSYVARDELTGAPLSPSSVLLELRDLLRVGYLAPPQLESLFSGPAGSPATAAVPLRRFDDQDRLRPGTLAHRESEAKQLGKSLRAALPAGSAIPDLPALRRALPGPSFDLLASRLGVHTPPARGRVGISAVAGIAGTGERLTVSLSAIRQFLEDPLQGSARFRLRMREVEGDEELLDREHESFVTERPLRAGLLREIMQRVLAGGEPSWPAVQAQLVEIARREELRGNAPTGFFAEAERPALEGILHGWWQQVQAQAAGRPIAGRVIRYGRPAPRERLAAESHPAIPLDIAVEESTGSHAVIPAELVGSTELLVGGQRRAPDDVTASLTLSCRSSSGDSLARQHRDRLRAFVDHLALAAAGLDQGAHDSFVAWASPSEHEPDLRRFRPVSSEVARQYLATIVTEMITGARDVSGNATGVHPYLLPCEGVFNAHKSGRPLAEEIEKLRDAYLEKPVASFSTVFGPVPEAVERHDPPSLAEAQRMAATRFGLYFDLLEPTK